MRYTHFVFDIDNTLINTTGAVLHGLQRALRDITGEHWDLSRLTPVLGIPGLDAFERLGIHSPEQIFQIYPRWEQYEQEYQYTESSPDSCVKCYTMFLPFLLIKIDVFS